jgi:hypothetical protein
VVLAKKLLKQSVLLALCFLLATHLLAPPCLHPLLMTLAIAVHDQPIHSVQLAMFCAFQLIDRVVMMQGLSAAEGGAQYSAHSPGSAGKGPVPDQAGEQRDSAHAKQRQN